MPFQILGEVVGVLVSEKFETKILSKIMPKVHEGPSLKPRNWVAEQQLSPKRLTPFVANLEGHQFSPARLVAEPQGPYLGRTSESAANVTKQLGIDEKKSEIQQEDKKSEVLAENQVRFRWLLCIIKAIDTCNITLSRTGKTF